MNKKVWINRACKIISIVFSAFICIAIGFCLDGLLIIKPQLEELATKMSQHMNETRVAIDYITYSTSDGIPCKVGINNKLDDHIVCVSSDDTNGLASKELIYLMKKSDTGWSMNTIMAVVKIDKVDKNAKASFYVNEKMLRKLGVDCKNPKNIGVFEMSFKKEKEERSGTK